MSTSIPISKPPIHGIYPIKYGRNGVVVDGSRVAGVCDFQNMIAGKRRKNHFVQYCKARSYEDTAVVTWVLFRTSPAIQQVRCNMIFAPAEFNGTAQWTIGEVAQTLIVTPGGSSTELVVVDQEFLAGDGSHLGASTEFQCSLELSNGALPVSITIYETQSWSIIPNIGPVVDLGLYRSGNAVSDASQGLPRQYAETLYRYGGNAHVAWSVTDGVPNSNATTTFKNIIDSGSGGWSAIAPGFEYWALNRGLMTSMAEDQARFWVYAEAGDDPNTGTVRFVGSAGTIATITGISSLDWYFVDANLDASLASDHMIIEAKNDTGSATTKVYSAGFFDSLPVIGI